MSLMRTRDLRLLAGALLFIACRHPSVRNPQLRMLRSDGFSIEHPVVASSGTGVYYLSGGTLWKVGVDTDSASLLTSGCHQAIALSSDGAKLALLGRGLLLVDSTGAVLQTVVPSESLGEDLIDVQFSHDGSHIYYSRVNGRGADYYRVALDGTGRELVHQSYGSAEYHRGQNGFTLTVDDSILESSPGQSWPALSPIDDSVVAYSSFWWSHGDVHIVHLSSDSVFGLDCYPYSNSRVAYPSWFPDGHRLVFCATDNGLDQPEHYQLWMIDSVEY